MFKTPKKHWYKILDINLGSHLCVSIWVIPVLTCAICGGYARAFLLTYSIALLHELSHVLCAHMLKVKISHVCIYPFGICARLAQGYINNSEKEFLTAFAGPFSNIIMFWFSSALNLKYCADVNLAMCIINLIPALPLDGGRLLKALLTPRLGIIRAYNLMLCLSRICVLALLFAALFVFFIYNFNFSLILISAFLLQNLCSEQKAVTVITLKEILNSKDKLTTASYTRVKVLCVTGRTPARTLLSKLSYDCFYVIHITDFSGKITKTVTEAEVLRSLTEKNIRIKYADV